MNQQARKMLSTLKTLGSTRGATLLCFTGPTLRGAGKPAGWVGVEPALWTPQQGKGIKPEPKGTPPPLREFDGALEAGLSTEEEGSWVGATLDMKKGSG